AIVVDDGIATGATTRAALHATRTRNPKKLVLAVPVAPTDSLALMRRECDDVVCLEDHEIFGAIGLFYSDFSQISDDEVIATLRRFPPRDSELTGESAMATKARRKTPDVEKSETKRQRLERALEEGLEETF